MPCFTQRSTSSSQKVSWIQRSKQIIIDAIFFFCGPLFFWEMQRFVFLMYDRLSFLRYANRYSLLFEVSTDPWKRAAPATSLFTRAIIAYIGWNLSPLNSVCRLAGALNGKWVNTEFQGMKINRCPKTYHWSFQNSIWELSTQNS